MHSYDYQYRIFDQDHRITSKRRSHRILSFTMIIFTTASLPITWPY